MASPVAYVFIFSVILVGFYKAIIYPAFLSPLARIPHAHWTCGFSSWWLLWKRWTHGENQSVHHLHMKYGPALRLGPNVISLNCFEEGLKKIYQGGFPKPVFYSRGFMIYGVENIFTFKDNATHSIRKRIISNTFSKSFIMASSTARAATRDVLFGRYLPLVYRAAIERRAVEVLELNYSYSMDAFVQWQYGRSLASNFIEDDKERRLYLDGFFGPSGYTFWQYEFPDFATLLRKIGIYLIPQWVDIGFKAIEDWNLTKCDKAHQLLTSKTPISGDDQPVVFEQAMKAMSEIHSKPMSYPQRYEIASDMFAHNSAAFETSGNTETYLFYEMCRNPEWQLRLQQELLGLNPPLYFVPNKNFSVNDFADPKAIDSLPILHAVIMETLRLWPAVPGAQPRVVPLECSLGGYNGIPAGTLVQSYAYALHRTPEIFPEPDKWKPERWIESSPEKLAEMKRWFWAFGSGGRMCIGSNFAFYSMKYLVAAVYTNFGTSIHDSGDMELIDAYLAGPKGHRLEIRFTVLEKATEN